jgi:hypothetical protein
VPRFQISISHGRRTVRGVVYFGKFVARGNHGEHDPTLTLSPTIPTSRDADRRQPAHNGETLASIG